VAWHTQVRGAVGPAAILGDGMPTWSTKLDWIASCMHASMPPPTMAAGVIFCVMCVPGHMPALLVAAPSCRRRPRRHVPRVAWTAMPPPVGVFFDKIFHRWSFLAFHSRRWSFMSKIRVLKGPGKIGECSGPKRDHYQALSWAIRDFCVAS
jgi:hypothetical protein